MQFFRTRSYDTALEVSGQARMLSLSFLARTSIKIYERCKEHGLPEKKRIWIRVFGGIVSPTYLRGAVSANLCSRTREK